jgi:Deoxyribonuclease II
MTRKCISGIAIIAVLAAEVVMAQSPTPLLAPNHQVDWWFVFKFNAATFPDCSGGATRQCVFGGTVQPYSHYGQQFVYASSEQAQLQKGTGCLGGNVQDPLGATVNQIYNGNFHYVIWNDQFYDAPEIQGCTKSCGAPWGHSKGMIAWDDSGAGVVLQVTTPSWPAAGSKTNPRQNDGNTLGCVLDDNVEVSQHFFALRLSKDDVISVLGALANASVVTDLTNVQIASSGGPPEVQSAVRLLGEKSSSTKVIDVTLSTQVRLIGKPSALHVPPWQLVSSYLDGAALRTATWWAPPRIPTTTAATQVLCWDKSLPHVAGPVEIATTGQWTGTVFGLKGGPTPNNNHAKVGVTIDQDPGYAIFGDLNQQGDLSGDKCGSSQNGRGGLFFIVQNADLV